MSQSGYIIKVPAIPQYQQMIAIASDAALNIPAICSFAACGFFLGNNTFRIYEIALNPATEYEINDAGSLLTAKPWWYWHYSPRDISLQQATSEFAHLFEKIIAEQVTNNRIILPLSGGLDSRTLAAALKDMPEVAAYSYEFHGGISETTYAAVIAEAVGFKFKGFTIPAGYLWDNIEHLATINRCYTEFTHPRQMAFFDQYAQMGDLFLLGHWGDVLFDDMGVPDVLPFEQQVNAILKKIVKKGGMELGAALWTAWGLTGNFYDYLRGQVEMLLSAIDIDNANARIRAFKSLYWAPRWTSVNLQVFAAARPIALPYYHEDMCKFICTVPEKWLAGRQIQIEYLKMKAPELARIPWQAHRPFNLYNYHWDKAPWNLPYRLWDKTLRRIRKASGRPLIQRNWELQFLGPENDKKLREYLFHNEAFARFVPLAVTQHFYDLFKKKDPVYYAHAVSMLLTLAVFSKRNAL